jgi:PAS domain S-box-containing protein
MTAPPMIAATPYIWLTAAASLSCVVVGLLLWPRRRTPGALTLLFIVGLACLWSLGYTAELAFGSLSVKIFFTKFNYFPITFLCPVWLVLAAQLVGRDDWLTRRRLVALFLPSLAFVFLALTNELHGLMWRSVVPVTDGASTLLDFERGPAFWAMIAYVYTCFFGGAVLAASAMAVGSELLRRDAAGLLAGAAIPMAASILFLSGNAPFKQFDPTPVAFVVSAAVWTSSLVLFRLYDVVPLVRDRVFSGMSDLVLAIDHGDRVTDLNAAACRAFGVHPSEVLGRPIADLLPEAAWQSLAGQPEGIVEITLPGPDAIRAYDVRVEPLRTVRGALLGRLLVLRDQTERMRADEVRLRLSRHEASASMVAGLAHRFEGLLGSLRANAQLVAERSGSDPRAMAYATEIRTAATRATELVEQMMHFSQEALLQARPVRVAALVDRVVEREQVRLPAHVRVVSTRTPGTFEVVGDVASLHQVVRGLVRNAVEAVASGPPNVRGEVTIELDRQRLGSDRSPALQLPRGEYVLLRVTDNGVGMGRETVARVFEPFFSTKGLGRGLGLAVAYGTVRSHRGEILVESVPAMGTTVTVYLPAISPRGRIRDVAASRPPRFSSRPPGARGGRAA